MRPISESEFYLYRSLVALCHADNHASKSEFLYLKDLFDSVSLTKEQISVLNSDFKDAQNLEEMFKGIKNSQDVKKFFYLSRILCWMDRNYSLSEVKAVESLQQIHLENIENIKNLEESDEVYRKYLEKKHDKVSKRLEEALDFWKEQEEGVKAA